MNLTTDRAQGIAIVRVGETRLMYPLLADFSGAVMGLLTSGDKKVMIDLSKVTYVDSATIGCLMDLYRQATAAGGELRLAGRQQARRDDADHDRRAQLPEDVSGRGGRPPELRELTMTMRSIKTTSGAEIVLDGDLLAVLETLYHEVTARKELERSFEDMKREIDHLIDQLTDDERREYLAESIFLNQVKYENDKLESYMRKLGKVGAQGNEMSAELPRHSVYLLVAVADWRDVVRRPHGVRLRRPLREARARRRAHHVDRRHLAGARRVAIAGRPEPGRLELLRRLPAQAAARRRSGAAAARPERQPDPRPAVYRVHRGLQHLLQPGGLRA